MYNYNKIHVSDHSKKKFHIKNTELDNEKQDKLYGKISTHKESVKKQNCIHKTPK
jgi:hypothetical protein